MNTQTIPVTTTPVSIAERSAAHSPSIIQTQHIITGWRMHLLELRIRLTIAREVFRHFKSPFKCLSIMHTLDRHRRSYLGEHRIKKIVRVDGRYYWDLYVPGWPSATFNQFISGEINRIAPVNTPANRFANVFMAVTKKCPLQCEHCFEWDALNGKEKLTLNDIKSMVASIQEKGTGQIQLTGGEPMLRTSDIVEIIQTAKAGTEFWILTSGFGVTPEKAKQLKKAGLTGVVISLDHFTPALHNHFRRFDKSFEWVEKAIKHAKEAQLVTALSLCATKTFVSEGNLMAYAELARNLGVALVQILEPRAVGHYIGQDVLLKPEHVSILEAFYLKMNLEPAYAAYPIINYHGYHQRRNGCMGAGDRMLYIDTDGDLHACPFCQKKYGSALRGQLGDAIEQLHRRGCHSFNDSII